MRKALFLSFLLMGLGTCADDPAGFVLFKASDMKAVEKQLAQKLTPQKTATQQFNNFGTHSVMMSHLEASGVAEIHETLTDVFIIQNGEATLTVGGKVIDGKVSAPGEIRGTSIEGGVTKKLSAGDIVNIPAGTPHHTQVASGQQVTYMVIKVRAK
jgi:mannose-6-phosphate isomerase-like protein (cupin superfamily)